MQPLTLTPSVELIKTVCSSLAIDTDGKTATELELIYWKAAYRQLANHIDQLQAAYGRVLLGECRTMDECAQFEADVAFLTDEFIRTRSCNSAEFTSSSG